MKYQRYDLPRIIKNDLILSGKTHLILFLLVLLSANCVVFAVYKTRLLITQEECLLDMQKKKKTTGEI